MKRIPLTRGHYALVDDIDYEYLCQWPWCFVSSGYAFRGPNVLMHRVIAKRAGITQSRYVDHKNQKKLDNRRKNLLRATNSQNGMNRGPQKNNTSGYKGVYWSKYAKKFLAQIKINQKAKYLGYFHDPLDAARAYNKAAKKYFGKFAYLNKV